MRILHTADWHLGKTLEGYSRLQEQEKFLQDLIEISEARDVDLILLCGDIYDSHNPPALAEKLFYKSMKQLAGEGKRAIVVIAGNHDNPERLMAASPLAYEHGLILLGKPGSVSLTGKFGDFEIQEAGEGYVKLKIRGEEAVILTLPYPSEKTLNEIISLEDDEEEKRKSYSERVGKFFAELSRHYKEDTINLAMAHLYISGGEESDSERQIQLGGSLAVDPAMLPDAQYIALGHLHRPQKSRGKDKNAYYSGSPLQYSKSEIHYAKSVYLVDLKVGEEARIATVYLQNHKAIEVWECDSIEAALQKCAENEEGDKWVYIDIKTDRVLTQAEIKEMKGIRKDIVQIRPIFEGDDERDKKDLYDYEALKIDDLFKEFYFDRRASEAPQDIMDLFYEIIQEEGEPD